MAQVILETKNEEGEEVTHNLHVEDDHVEDERRVLTSLAERAEKASTLQSENSTLREAIVSEVVRRRKLAGEIDEDGVEQEREFLLGLPAGRLKQHYDRALDLSLDTGGALDPSTDPSDKSGNAYDEKGL